jgi:hypothetical protein
MAEIRQMPTMQAIAYFNFAIERQDSLFGSDIVRTSPGYVDQQLNKILARKGKHGI